MFKQLCIALIIITCPEIWALSLSSQSQLAQEHLLEQSFSLKNQNMRDFICAVIDLSPESSLSDLQKSLKESDIDPARLHYYQQLLKTVSGYQFAKHFFVREWISNAIDASNKDPQNPAHVHVNSQRGMIQVQDQGAGMRLKDLIHYFLLPMRSSKNSNQSIGQFGLGFFSSFAYLQDPEDKIIIRTKHQSNRLGWTVAIFRSQDSSSSQNQELMFTIEQNNQEDSGTTIELHSQSLDKQSLQTIQRKSLHDSFDFQRDALIIHNGVPINTPNGIRQLWQSDQKDYALYKQDPSDDQPASLKLLSGGVTLKEWKLPRNQWTTRLALELPKDSVSTQSREEHNLSDSQLKALLKPLIEGLINDNQIQALNSLYPLIKDFPLLLQTIHEQLSNKDILLLPDVPSLKDHLHNVFEQNVYWAHPEYLASITLPESLKSSLLHTQATMSLISTEGFKNPKDKTIYHMHNGHTYIFASDIDLTNHKDTLLYQAYMLKNSKHNMPQSLAWDFDLLLKSLGIEQGAERFSLEQHSPQVLNRLYEHSLASLKDFHETTPITNDFAKFCLDILMPHPQIYYLWDTDSLFSIWLHIYTMPNKSDEEKIKDAREVFLSLKHLSSAQLLRNLLSENSLYTSASTLPIFNPRLYNDLPSFGFYKHQKENSPQIVYNRYLKYRDFQKRLQDILEQSPELQHKAYTKLVPFLHFFYLKNSMLSQSLINGNIQLVHRTLLLVQKALDQDELFSLLIRHASSDPHNPSLLHLFGKKNRPIFLDPYLEDDQIFEHVLNEAATFLLLNDRIYTEKNPPIQQRIIALLQEYFQKDTPRLEPQEGVKLSQAIKFWQKYQWDMYKLIRGHKKYQKRFFDQLYRQWNSKIISYILFLNQNLQRPVMEFPESLQENSMPLSEDPQFQKQISMQHSDRVKLLKRAMTQHPNPYAFIIELIKNAAEAGSPSLDFTIAQDRQGHLILQVQDQGTGISAKDLANIYIPGVSSKNQHQRNNINFGWGFYTVFGLFKKALITSQKAESPAVALMLSKHPEHILNKSEEHHSEIYPQSVPGTTLYLQSDRSFSDLEANTLKAEIIHAAKMVSNIEVRVNGQEIHKQAQTKQNFQDAHLLTETENPLANISIYQYTPGGFYYQGLLKKNLSISKYLAWLPQSLLKYQNLLENQLAINIEGDLQENINRLGFIEQEALDAIIQPQVAHAALELLAKLYSEERVLLPFLSEDIFKEFGNPFSDEYSGDVFWLEGLSDDSKERIIEQIIYHRILFNDKSLKSIHLEIKDHFQKHNFFDNDMRFKHDTNAQQVTNYLKSLKLPKGLQKLFLMHSLSAIDAAKLFHKNTQEQGFDNFQAREVSFECSMFDYITHHKIILLKTFLEGVLNSALKTQEPNKFKVFFYSAANNINAYTHQEGSTIFFNLSSLRVAQFLRLTEDDLDNDNVFFDWLSQILETLAHEYTHTQEIAGTHTHTETFFKDSHRHLGRLMHKQDPLYEHTRKFFKHYGLLDQKQALKERLKRSGFELKEADSDILKLNLDPQSLPIIYSKAGSSNKASVSVASNAHQELPAQSFQFILLHAFYEISDDAQEPNKTTDDLQNTKDFLQTLLQVIKDNYLDGSNTLKAGHLERILSQIEVSTYAEGYGHFIEALKIIQQHHTELDWQEDIPSLSESLHKAQPDMIDKVEEAYKLALSA